MKRVLFIMIFSVLSVITYAQTSYLICKEAVIGRIDDSGDTEWDEPVAVNIPVTLTISEEGTVHMILTLGDDVYIYNWKQLIKNTDYPDKDGDYMIRWSAHEAVNDDYCTIRFYYKQDGSAPYSSQIYINYDSYCILLRHFISK